jgi:hypothetical protein
MKVDRYTRVVLTVIAVCLVWLSLGGPSLLTPVAAQQSRQSGYERVIIAGWIDSGSVEHTLDSKVTARLPVDVGNQR